MRLVVWAKGRSRKAVLIANTPDITRSQTVFPHSRGLPDKGATRKQQPKTKKKENTGQKRKSGKLEAKTSETNKKRRISRPRKAQQTCKEKRHNRESDEHPK
jgi:hypothetical protein